MPEHIAVNSKINDRERDWKTLCDRFLPVERVDSIWRYSRLPRAGDAAQGWKLHISATVLTAADVLAEVAPPLFDAGVHFKAPASLAELRNLNAGLAYGYTQIGKFITVYPRSDGEAAALAERLDKLTKHFAAPSVPFDFRYRAASNVYYRYGAFATVSTTNADGKEIQVLRDAEGNSVEDARDAENACPAWATNPFPLFADAEKSNVNPLDDCFKIFNALSQRGKGGVYQAIDVRPRAPRLCVVKEGRRSGETDWDGRDGYCRLKHEKFILAKLAKAGIDAPRVYAAFETRNNYYLVMEALSGATLADLFVKRSRRFPVVEITDYAVQIARIVAEIHRAGFVWRDLKPSNLMVDENGRVRAFDFEGACAIDKPDELPWSTAHFMPPEARANFTRQSYPAADLFALGVVLYLLIEDKFPENPATEAIVIRRRIPARLKKIVLSLLDREPERRFSAVSVENQLVKLRTALAEKRKI